jgi:hypothetical protein
VCRGVTGVRAFLNVRYYYVFNSCLCYILLGWWRFID